MSNVGAAPIRCSLLSKQPPDHSQLSVPLVPILDETFQITGILRWMQISEVFLLLILVFARPTTDSSFRWVYAQFIAVDANFWLKLKNWQISDPELGSGWAYFVKNSAYTRHVTNDSHETEVGHVLGDGGNILTPVPGHRLRH